MFFSNRISAFITILSAAFTLTLRIIPVHARIVEPLFRGAEDTLVVGLDSPLLTLDPRIATDASSIRVSNLVHAALVVREQDLGLKPDLASGWVVGKNRLVFHMRPGLMFQDGSPLTAQHVAASLEYFRKLPRLADQFASIVSIRVTNPATLQINLNGPVLDSFLNDLYVVKIFKEEDSKIIAAGRFALERSLHQGALLKRSTTFYKPVPKGAFNRIELLFFRDDTTRYQQLLRGGIDVLPSSLSFSKTDYLRKEAQDWLTIRDYPGVAVQYLAFQFKHPALQNLKVRQAIAHGFNRQLLVETRFKGYAVPTETLLNSYLPEYEKLLKKYDYDLASAEKLLDEAGFLRGKNGVRLSFNLKVTPYKDSIDFAQIFADDMAKIGIHIDVRPIETTTFFSDTQAGRFELMTSRWPSVIDPFILYRVFHSSQIGKWNRGSYVNHVIDKALDSKNYGLAQKLIAEDLPYLHLWRWNQTIITTRRVKPFEPFYNGDLLVLADVVHQ